MTTEEQRAAEAQRWILLNKAKGLDEKERAELLELSDILVGYPRPGRPSKQAASKATSPVKPGRTIKVALVVGHNETGNQGAWLKYGSIKESEFVFNGKVAQLIKSKGVPGVEFKIFKRKNLGSYSKEIADVYRRVNTWKPDFVYELHFNASNSANYVSMFIAKVASEKTERLASIVHEQFRKALKIPGKGVFRRTRSQRGGVSMYSAKAPMVLTEPFFGDNPTHCKKVSELGHAGIADIYRSAIKDSIPLVA